jgi:hypothetical protein
MKWRVWRATGSSAISSWRRKPLATWQDSPTYSGLDRWPFSGTHPQHGLQLDKGMRERNASPASSRAASEDGELEYGSIACGVN